MLRLLLRLLRWPVTYGYDFRALRIVVGNGPNFPEKDALVELETEGKLVASVRTDENGEAAFCDFGFHEHRVRVRERCNDIVVRRIFLDPSTERKQRIVLQHCSSNGSFGRGGMYHIRALTSGGEPVPGVQPHVREGQARLKSNAYGVLRFAIRAGDVFEARIAADGVRPVNRTMGCGKVDIVKETVTLERVE